jgi:hypothetical protein
MEMLNLPSHLEDKIFELRFDSENALSRIVSYFPLSEPEKQEIISILGNDLFVGFHSIFTDRISKEEWSKTKEQIKKKFKDELFDIDNV